MERNLNEGFPAIAVATPGLRNDNSSSGTSSLAPTTSGSNTTSGSKTEFTKRRNWSKHIIEKLNDFIHVISPTGKLMYCSPSSTEMVGYTPEELVNRVIMDFIHVDDVDMFVRDFNDAMQQKTSFIIYYRFRKKDDKFITLEVNGHPYFDENDSTDNCKCFFSTGRAYPSKTTAMLDSFLELKVENENLRRQLCDLIESDTSTEGGGSNGSGNNNTVNITSIIVSGDGHIVEDILQDARNTVELLTGIREGELASGISTGSTDPSLLNENLMDIDMIPLVKSSRDDNLVGVATTTNQKRPKKKPKVEEHVCTDCGTVESPEWRKGPHGPKSLCNACGLRWAKKTKRQAGGGGGSGLPPAAPNFDSGGVK